MLYTMRTFLVDRADVARFVELSETAIWPALEGREGRALGLWQVVMGGEERIVLLNIARATTPYMETLERVSVERLSLRLIRVTARFGYMETPRIDPILKACGASGLDLDRDVVDQARAFLAQPHAAAPSAVAPHGPSALARRAVLDGSCALPARARSHYRDRPWPQPEPARTRWKGRAAWAKAMPSKDQDRGTRPRGTHPRQPGRSMPASSCRSGRRKHFSEPSGFPEMLEKGMHFI